MYHIPPEMLTSAYNQQLFSLMAKHLHACLTPLLNMDVLIFWLMVGMHLHLSLTCHQHKDKNHDHRELHVVLTAVWDISIDMPHSVDTCACAQVVFIFPVQSRLLQIFGL